MESCHSKTYRQTSWGTSCHRRLTVWSWQSFCRRFSSAGSSPDLDIVHWGHLKHPEYRLSFSTTNERKNYAGTLFVASSLALNQTPCYAKTTNPTSARIHFLHLLFFLQRTEIPDLFVNILEAMFMDANSWKSNFAA